MRESKTQNQKSLDTTIVVPCW